MAKLKPTRKIPFLTGMSAGLGLSLCLLFSWWHGISMAADNGGITKKVEVMASSSPVAKDQDYDEEYDEEYDYGDEEESLINDPLEGFNRVMFTFNDRLYFHVLKPVARGYRFVTPKKIRMGIRNFFYNIIYPVRFVNDLLQGKFKRAGKETCRFIVNTSVGFLGFMTPSKDYAWLNPPPEDTGQTFATWGIGNGFYIVWPLLGPSTVRDSFGFLGDYVLEPDSYLQPLSLSFGIRGFEIINKTSLTLGEYETLKESSFDPYIAVRNAYIQNRRQAIKE